MNKIKKVIIPLAGYGSSLFPATMFIPKALTPIGNQPCIQYIIRECLDAGIKKFIFVISPEQDLIVKYLSKTEVSKLVKKFPEHKELARYKAMLEQIESLDFVIQRQRKGLGHAIYSARNLIEDEDFAVILGDNPIINTPDNYCGTGIKELSDLYEKNNLYYVGLKEVNPLNISKYGIATLEEDKMIKTLIEKPQKAESNLAIAGRYILPSKIFDYIKEYMNDYKGQKEYDLTYPLNEMAFSEMNLYGHNMNSEILDMGKTDVYSSYAWIKSRVL